MDKLQVIETVKKKALLPLFAVIRRMKQFRFLKPALPVV